MSRIVADAVVEVLADLGAKVVFGLPGVHNLTLFDALERSPLETVVVRHEATAAYAADAVGRISGNPGVCVTTSGPGAANTVAAMGEAQASGSPLVHITTTVPRQHLDAERTRGVLHEHPRQRDIFEPVAKLALHVGEAEDAAGAVRHAFEVASTAAQGPAYLQLPADLLGDEEPGGRSSPGTAPTAPDPEAQELDALARALDGANRPAIWVGSGSAPCAAEVAELAERLGAPVILTHGAKRRWSAAPHRLVLTHPPHEPPIADLLAKADTVLVLGSDLDGMMTQEFRLTLDRILRVDIDPQRVRGDDRYPSFRAVAGDASSVLDALLDLVPERPGGWGIDAVRAADAAARGALETEADATGGLTFVDALDQALAEAPAVVLCDMAIAGYWTAGYLPLTAGRRILYPVGWGTLGFALPASIGAAFAGHGRAIAVCGDGGVLFSIGELATMVQEGLDVTVIVQNDRCYGMLRYDEERRFGRTFAVDLETPDFVTLAKSFGVRAEAVDLEDGRLPELIARSFAQSGPALVEVRAELSPPRITSPRWPLTDAGMRAQ